MTQQHSNSWHKKLYGEFSAKTGLDSKSRHKQAEDEVNFLIRALDLNEQQSILDVPCGTGRHSLAFGKRGYKVVGVDLGLACLKLAKENCNHLENVRIKRGDMASLSWARGKFDLVTNLFSSFGYFKSDSENKRVLKGFVAALKPGGHVVIQTINREWLLKIFDAARWGESSSFFWQEGTRYDPKTKYVESCRMFLDKKTGKGERSYNRMKIYSIPEMKELMRDVGLRNIKAFGDINGGQPNRHKSTHPIYIGEK